MLNHCQVRGLWLATALPYRHIKINKYYIKVYFILNKNFRNPRLLNLQTTGTQLALTSSIRNCLSRTRLALAEVPQQLGRSFDWLRCYAPVLQDWEKKGLLIERVDLGLGATDPISYRMQISYECPEAGKRIYGYGESTRELFAYEKAIAELVEREAMFLHGIQLGIKTTNGLAAHRFTFLAKQTAKIELQERDAFLRHWLTRTPLLKISDPDDALVRAFRRAIEAEGYNLILASTYMGRIPSVIELFITESPEDF